MNSMFIIKQHLKKRGKTFMIQSFKIFPYSSFLCSTCTCNTIIIIKMIWKKVVIMIKDKPRCMRNFTTLLFAMDVYQIYIVFVFTKEYFIAKTIIFFVIKE